MKYTSRTAIEVYQDCHRLRYNMFHLLGKGVVGKALAVPIVTGSAVHRGVEHIANRIRIGQVPDVDTAVGLAVDEYIKECEGAGFSGKGLQTDRQQWFTFCEQKALLEGLIRMWYLIELPNITQRYTILAVEREVVPVWLFGVTYLQAKLDMELQEIATGEYYNYSLKTCNQWGERMEQSYKSDLQGITEVWAIQQESVERIQRLEALMSNLEHIAIVEQHKDPNIGKILTYLQSKTLNVKRIMGIRFCYLVKGIRKKPEYNADENVPYITYSPLIRGYKCIQPTGTSYAHSWFYPNSNNKSGKSALGKGWEPFNVWESEITMKDWVNALYQNQIQPECGNVLRANVITPAEYFRDDKDVELAIKEVIAQESKIAKALEQLEVMKDGFLAENIMHDVFPHNRKSCYFYYGDPCPYLALCWKPEVAADPIGSGLYQIRVPHHEYERNGA